jgi:hypothetical protein
MRKWIAVFALCVGVIGCTRASTFAKGTGYGVGIPRTNFTFGKEPASRGFTTQGVSAPSERDIGRIKQVTEPLAGQVGRVR